MSVILSAIDTIRSALTPFRQPTTDEMSGADAVYAAINEMGDMTTGVYDATLGEPDIEANAGLFTTDPKVVIPIENTKYGEAGTLVFDLPDGPADDSAEFWSLLDAFDISLPDLHLLEGKSVPVRYSGGNVIVMWDQLRDDEGSNE